MYVYLNGEPRKVFTYASNTFAKFMNYLYEVITVF